MWRVPLSWWWSCSNSGYTILNVRYMNKSLNRFHRFDHFEPNYAFKKISSYKSWLHVWECWYFFVIDIVLHFSITHFYQNYFKYFWSQIHTYFFIYSIIYQSLSSRDNFSRARRKFPFFSHSSIKYVRIIYIYELFSMDNQKSYQLVLLYVLYNIVIFMITTTDAEGNGLQTRKGIIYGRQTEYTMEYLGWDILGDVWFR